jgi:hypothetical protein
MAEHKYPIKDDAAELRIVSEGPNFFWLECESVGGSGWSQTLSREELSGLRALIDEALKSDPT